MPKGAAKGRCAGCGRTGPVRKLSAHIADCQDWAALYAADPSRILDPAGEYARWLAEDKQAERAARRDVSKARSDQRREDQQGRFARLKDPLED